MRLARLGLAGGLAAALALGAAQGQPSEAQVKAAFIPKIARYVEWPAAVRPGPREPFQLCVVGRDGFGPLLDQAARSERIDGRGVAVRRVGGVDGAAGCHLAVVRGADPRETGRMLLALSGQPILTITDARFGPQRGIVHFVVVGRRVRFYVDEAAAAEGGLAISSRLLALALSVRQRRS